MVYFIPIRRQKDSELTGGQFRIFEEFGTSWVTCRYQGPYRTYSSPRLAENFNWMTLLNRISGSADEDKNLLQASQGADCWQQPLDSRKQSLERRQHIYRPQYRRHNRRKCSLPLVKGIPAYVLHKLTQIQGSAWNPDPPYYAAQWIEKRSIMYF